jgi:hypothetical protein
MRRNQATSLSFSARVSILLTTTTAQREELVVDDKQEPVTRRGYDDKQEPDQLDDSN